MAANYTDLKTLRSGCSALRRIRDCRIWIIVGLGVPCEYREDPGFNQQHHCLSEEQFNGDSDALEALFPTFSDSNQAQNLIVSLQERC